MFRWSESNFTEGGGGGEVEITPSADNEIKKPSAYKVLFATVISFIKQILLDKKSKLTS